MRSILGSFSSSADTPETGGKKQPRRHQSKSSGSNALPSPDSDSRSRNESVQDPKRADLVDGRGSRVATNSPETIRYSLVSDGNSESGSKQTDRTITTVTTAQQVQEVRSTTVQQTGQIATTRKGIAPPQRNPTISQTTIGQQQSEAQSYSEGELQKKTVLYHDTSLPTDSTSMIIEARHFTPPSISTSGEEDSLAVIHQAHRQEIDQMFNIMNARREEQQRRERIFEEQIESLRMEYEKLVRRLSAAISENAMLKVQLSSHDDGRPGTALPHDELLSTVTSTITTITTAVTTVTTRIERWRDEVVKNKGKITLSKTDLDRLFSDLSDTSSQMTRLQQDYFELSKESSSIRQQLELTLPLVKERDNSIAALTAEVTQFKSASTTMEQQMAALREDNQRLRNDVSTYSSRTTEHERSQEALSTELGSLRREMKTKVSLIEEKDKTINSFTTEVAQLKQSEIERTKQFATLRQDHTKLQRDSSSQIAELQRRYDILSKDRDSIQKESQDNKTLVERERTIEVEKLKRELAIKIAQLDTLRQEKEKLRQDCTTHTSQVSTLQGRCDAQSNQIISLRSEIQNKDTLLAEKGRTITALTTERDRGRSEHGEETVNLKKQLDARLIEVDTLRKELTQIEHLIKIPTTGTPSDRRIAVYVARVLEEKEKEIVKLRQELTAATSLNHELRSGVTKVAHYEEQVAKLNSQLDRLKRLLGTAEEQREGARKGLQQVQRNLDVSSTRITELQQQSDTQSAQLKVFREEFVGICGTTIEAEEWSTIQTKIMAQVKDYDAVLKLTAEVGEWMSARAKAYDELQAKLITLKQIYVAAPRIKQIFQSETTGVKTRHEEQTVVAMKRYEEETKALKIALADSQSQLRGVQRVVSTADTFADESIIQELKKLNAEVQQNTTFMADGIAKDHRSRKATKEQISMAARFIGKALTNCLTTMASGDAELYLSIAFQAYFSYYLCRVISSWTTEKAHNDFIEQIYEQLQKAERQQLSGRWRALTRAYISPTWTSDLSALTQQIVADLSVIVMVAGCASSAASANSKLSSFRDKVSSIVSVAGQFSEMVGKVVSADFTVIAPPPLQGFEETTMEEDVDDYDKGKKRRVPVGEKVLCSTQLGMTKQVEVESRRETLSVVKAKVVLESFLDG